MTANDTIEHQSDSTAVKIGLEDLVEKVLDELDSVVSITIGHLMTYTQPNNIRITVYTREADSFEDYLQLFTPDHRIVIERDDETLLVPFTILATFDGPVTWDSVEQTTIYMKESVLGAKPVQLEDGLAYLRDKLKYPSQWSNKREFQLDQIRNYIDELDNAHDRG